MVDLPAVHSPVLILPSQRIDIDDDTATPTLVKPIEAYVIFFLEATGESTAATVMVNHWKGCVVSPSLV